MRTLPPRSFDRAGARLRSHSAYPRSDSGSDHVRPIYTSPLVGYRRAHGRGGGSMAVTDLPVRPMLIAGRPVSEGAAGSIDLMDPSTGRAVGTAPLAGVADIDRAVSAAKAIAPEWAATAGAERGRIL